MDKTLIIVSAVVGSLGVLSAIFGFSAEGTKLTPYDIIVVYNECIYPQNPALGLGICAAVFLLAAQVIFTAVGGCCGCCGKSRSNPPSETKRIIGIVCAVVSWIAAVIAWVLFIDGAALNASTVRMDCRYLKDGVFAGAGVLSLAATGLGITSYVLTRPKAAAAPVPVVEGEPKLPPATTQGNGSLQNQEPQRTSTETVPPVVVVASAPPEPSEPAPGTEMGQPPVQLPQVGVPNDTAQFSIQPPQVPMISPNAAHQQQGSDQQQLIRNEITKAGIKLAARVVEHTLFSGSIDTGVGDILVSMTDLQSTDTAY